VFRVQGFGSLLCLHTTGQQPQQQAALHITATLHALHHNPRHLNLGVSALGSLHHRIMCMWLPQVQGAALHGWCFLAFY
jgi:hypothetical protein